MFVVLRTDCKQCYGVFLLLSLFTLLNPCRLLQRQSRTIDENECFTSCLDSCNRIPFASVQKGSLSHVHPALFNLYRARPRNLLFERKSKFRQASLENRVGIYLHVLNEMITHVAWNLWLFAKDDDREISLRFSVPSSFNELHSFDFGFNMNPSQFWIDDNDVFF